MAGITKIAILRTPRIRPSRKTRGRIKQYIDVQQHTLQQQLRLSALSIHPLQGQHHLKFLGKYSGWKNDFIKTLIGLITKMNGIRNSEKSAHEITLHFDVSMNCIPKQPNTLYLSKWSSLNFYPQSQHH